MPIADAVVNITVFTSFDVVCGVVGVGGFWRVRLRLGLGCSFGSVFLLGCSGRHSFCRKHVDTALLEAADTFLLEVWCLVSWLVVPSFEKLLDLRNILQNLHECFLVWNAYPDAVGNAVDRVESVLFGECFGYRQEVLLVDFAFCLLSEDYDLSFLDSKFTHLSFSVA